MIPLEDKHNDIIGKARRGLGLSFADVARHLERDENDLKEWEAGRAVPDDQTLVRLAEVLRLAPSRLVESAHQKWYPENPQAGRLKNLLQATSHYGDMLVNAYLTWDISTHDAALFDTGTNFQFLKEKIDSYPLNLRYVFLTHAHADHVAVLDQIHDAWRPEIYTSKGEYVRNAKVAAEGDSFKVGRISVQVLETEGHSPGGLTYLLRGIGERLPAVAVVGDALFAGSVGGPMHSYERLLANLRKKILTLPDDTLLAPGHGPFTTVGEEKKHNPFFG